MSLPLSPRWRQIAAFWPEALIALLALFFCLRELGTFPAAWLDDGFFMVIAKNIAMGKGYSLPVLGTQWTYPFFLGVGPTLLLPPALAIAAFGFSVEAARLPMALYLLATIACAYGFTRATQNRNAARWSALLLLTLSAFINTGKPVLGEVPAFFFLLSGCWCLYRRPASPLLALGGGVLLGLSVVTKLTFGLLYPAVGIAFLFALWQRDRASIVSLLIAGSTATLTFLAFNPILQIIQPEFFSEIHQYGLADGGSQTFALLRTNPELLLRIPYLFFAVLLALGLAGMWVSRRRLPQPLLVLHAMLVSLFLLYFLDSQGWYRYLLPAHLLLLPFVPTGLGAWARKRMAAGVLLFFVLAQAGWQLQHGGSSNSGEAEKAAAVLERSYRDTTMVIYNPEIYVRLRENPRWFFLSEEMLWRKYPLFTWMPLKPEQHCLPILRRLSPEETALAAGKATHIEGRYFLVHPPASCAHVTR